MGIYDVFEGGSQPFDKAAWIAKKNEEKQAAYELADSTADRMKTDGDAFRSYLDVQGRFDRYSVTNAILVAAQKPDATQLKDFKKWREDGVTVDKDATKITILEPGNEYTRHDGTRTMGFNAKTLYDVSETSAKDTPVNVPRRPMQELVAALAQASPVKCVAVDELEMPAYYDMTQQTIFIRKGLNENHLFAGVAKEVAAATYDFKLSRTRDFTEFGSYCVAYMLCKKNGVPVDGFRFDTLPSEFSDMESSAFKRELGDIRSVLSDIHGAMYKTLDKDRNDHFSKSKPQAQAR